MGDFFIDNVCKASLHYKTQDGALRGDVLMSLIATCEQNGANCLHYLTKIQEYRPDIIANPHLWFPWNYLDRLRHLTRSTSPPQLEQFSPDPF